MTEMKPEQWKQVDDLLQSALDHTPEERTDFLAQACAGRESLRAEVETLLAHYDQVETFLETPPSEIAAEILERGKTRLIEGQQVGHYKTLVLLGAGGMGEVYLAHDTKLDRKVALKLLPARFTTDEHSEQRFEQEARSASALNHPNIVTIHEIGRFEETHFIVTEFIEGQTLRRRIMDGPMPLTEALDVAIQLASALDAAHSAGIIHRDVKPENIMLRPDGLVKVLDFGLAKLIDVPASTFDTNYPGASLRTTHPGMLIGTAHYMSPEQARGREVDAQTDVWSLGVVIYEMVTGRAPFDGATMSDVLAAIIKDEPLPLARFSSAPAELERIERRALSKALEERYASAREMYLDLKQLDQELKLRAKLKELSPAVTDQQPSLIMNRRRAIWLGGTAVAALSGLTVWRFMPTSLQRLAVLPFRNTENVAEAEPICTGLTAELIYALSETPWLDVPSQSSVSNFKDKDVDPRDAGRKLEASFILTGDVQFEDKKPTIKAVLYDAANGKELWHDYYSTFSSNTHQQIASAVVDLEALGILTDFERSQRDALPAVNQDAWNYYWRGRRQLQLVTPIGYERALELFQRAIKLDSNFALAYSQAAASWSAKALDGIESPAEAFKNQFKYLQIAQKLDPNLPGVHNELGARAFAWDWDWKTAEEEFERSITPNRGYVIDPLYYGSYAAECLAVGRFTKALDLVGTGKKKGKRPGADVVEANLTLLQGNINEAIKRYKNVVRLYPGNENANLGLEEAYRLNEDFPNAIAIRRVIATKNGLLDESLEKLFNSAGDKDAYREIVQRMARLDLQELDNRDAASEYVSPLDRARDYARLDDRESAFRYLHEAYDEKSTGLVFLKVDPIWNPIRDDPQFRELVDKMKFP
jgi:eukaryotic-like serine/threonine-protein kinase